MAGLESAGLREVDPIFAFRKESLFAYYNEKDKTHYTVLQNKKASNENVKKKRHFLKIRLN